MKNELLERIEEINAEPEATAPITGRPSVGSVAATGIFRRQEPFWKQVRQRIVEKDPAFVDVLDRLY